MTRTVSPVACLHMFAALAALVIGTVELARPKGTGSHKAIGWTWVAPMAAVAVSLLWIPVFLQFGWIHHFTLLTAIVLPLGSWCIRDRNVRVHAGTVRGLYIGGLGIAGVFTLSPGQLLGNPPWKGCWACQ
jgi:uncharacterized membrane protein